jgi:hypothetical protein
MARSRKVLLPIVEQILARVDAGKPTLENTRRRLGGRTASGPGAGDVVTIDVAGAPTRGVVLFASDVLREIIFEGGVVRRAAPEACAIVSGAVAGALGDLANSVRVFASLREGDEVCYEPPDDSPARGTLIEKCRYGALVASADGRIVAVGFGKLWPAARVTDGSIS